FQAEDGIRDRNVTGVQTCALPIYGRGNAREDVADARPRSDHRKNSLALEHVEVLGDEGPKVEHDQLECDRIDDVRDEGDLGVLADRVGDEDGDGGDGVGDEVDSERATNAKSAGQRALQ